MILPVYFLHLREHTTPWPWLFLSCVPLFLLLVSQITGWPILGSWICTSPFHLRSTPSVGRGLRAINENISPPIVIYLILTLNLLNVGVSLWLLPQNWRIWLKVPSLTLYLHLQDNRSSLELPRNYYAPVSTIQKAYHFEDYETG